MYLKCAHIIKLLLGILLLETCGPSSNIFTLITAKKQKEFFDADLSNAMSAYDNSDYETALEFGLKAYAYDPYVDETAIVLGYTYLALAGFTPFEIIEKMIDANSSASTSGASQASAKTGASASTGTSGASGSTGASGASGATGAAASTGSQASASKSLDQLKDLLSLRSEELSNLGTIDNDNPTYPLLIPKCADETRIKVPTLHYVNEAIKIICPFVLNAGRVLEDPRHHCKGPIKQKPKADVHFIWALSHLMEALVFHSVITYSTQNSGKSNLEKRVESIQKTTITDPLSQLPGFIKKINSLKKTIDWILPSNNECSKEYPQTQFSALVTDLVTVGLGFKLMRSLPKEVTQKLTDAIDSIQNIKAKTKAATQKKAQTEALKTDFTKTMTKTLGAKIAQLANDPSAPLSKSQLKKLCESLKSINSGAASADTPKECADTP